VQQQPDVSHLPPAQAALTLGNWNYDHQNWPQAIEQYQRAIAAGMDTADVRTDLGNAYRFSDEPKKALEQYQTARKLNPLHENSLINTATLYTEVLHDRANAGAAWREYLQRFPNGENAATARKFLLDETSPPAGLK
jgi:tetratricopeptide (TPR) repeat protein